MNEQQIIIDILNQIKLDMVGLLFKAALAYMFIIIGKNILTSLASYAVFRINKSIAINTAVEYDGFAGHINEISLFFISIKNKEGDIKKVRIEDWWKGKVTFLDTHYNCKSKE